jgi:hypothetical protein
MYTGSRLLCAAWLTPWCRANSGARVLSCLPVVKIQQGKTRFDDRVEKAVQVINESTSII